MEAPMAQACGAGRASLGLAGSVLPRSIFYGWYIVAAGAVNAGAVIGLAIFSFGVFVVPIRDDLGWSTAAIALGFTFQRIESGLFSPVVGYTTDRIGPRRVVFIGVSIIVASFLLLAAMQELWQFYLASIVVSLGQSMGSVGPFGAAIMNWFYAKRSRAISILMAGAGLGGLLVYPLVVVIDAFGWRGAMIASAIFMGTIGYLSAFILYDRPEPHGLRPDGVSELDASRSSAPPPSGTYGLTVAESVRTYSFWLYLAASTLFGMTNLAFVVLQFPALMAKGFSSAEASAVVTMYAALLIACRIFIAWLSVRVGTKAMVFASMPLQAAGLVGFALVDAFIPLVPFYALYSAGQSLWAINGQTLVAEYFGTRRFATIRGLLTGISSVGGAVGPVLAAWVAEDLAGGYGVSFLVFGLVCAVCTPLVVVTDALRPSFEPVTAVASRRSPRGRNDW